MVPALRKAFNAAFTKQQYDAFLTRLKGNYPGAIEFHVAETPVFVPKEFADKINSVCETIIDRIVAPDFKKLTERSIPSTDRVPNEKNHCHFLVFDFGVCIDEDTGELQPKLIEMQGFPSLFGFQVYYPDLLREYFSIPGNYSQYLNGYDRDSYLS